MEMKHLYSSLTRYKKLLSTSDMQFAYKGDHSTVMCSLSLKETVNHYVLDNTLTMRGGIS